MDLKHVIIHKIDREQQSTARYTESPDEIDRLSGHYFRRDNEFTNKISYFNEYGDQIQSPGDGDLVELYGFGSFENIVGGIV